MFYKSWQIFFLTGDVVDLEITVWGVKSAVAGLQWRNFRKYRSDIDFRSLLGYVVYYREA